MLRRAMELKGNRITTQEGQVGSLDDLYFDDRRWGVCFLVVATGPWPIGRKMLVSSRAVERQVAAAALRERVTEIRLRMTREQLEQSPAADDPPGSDLLSSTQLVGCNLEAPDGAIGHVEDLVVDDESWEIADMVVDTRKWLPGGKRVLVAPTAVESIDAPAKTVHVRLSRDEVRNSPEAAVSAGG